MPFLGVLLQKDDHNGNDDSNNSESNGTSRNIDRSYLHFADKYQQQYSFVTTICVRALNLQLPKEVATVLARS